VISHAGELFRELSIRIFRGTVVGFFPAVLASIFPLVSKHRRDDKGRGNGYAVKRPANLFVIAFRVSEARFPDFPLFSRILLRSIARNRFVWERKISGNCSPTWTDVPKLFEAAVNRNETGATCGGNSFPFTAAVKNARADVPGCLFR